MINRSCCGCHRTGSVLRPSDQVADELSTTHGSCKHKSRLAYLPHYAARDVELLMTLYMKCVKACKKAIQSYCSNWDADHALVIAKKVLSTACSRLCPTARYGSRLDVFDNSGR